MTNWDEELYTAAFDGDIDTAKRALRKGANVNWKDEYGWTPLMRASEKGNTDMVEFLLVNGADRSIKNNVGVNAMDIAQLKNHSLTRQKLDTLFPKKDDAIKLVKRNSSNQPSNQSTPPTERMTPRAPPTTEQIASDPLSNVDLSVFMSKIPINEQIRDLQNELEDKEMSIERMKRDLRESVTKLKISEENLTAALKAHKAKEEEYLDEINDLEFKLDTLEGRILNKMNPRELNKLKQKLINVLVTIDEFEHGSGIERQPRMSRRSSSPETFKKTPMLQSREISPPKVRFAAPQSSKKRTGNE